MDAQSEEEWDVAGAVAELPQLSDSEEDAEEGDDRDRYYFIMSRPAPGGDIYHASRVGDVERVTCAAANPNHDPHPNPNPDLHRNPYPVKILRISVNTCMAASCRFGLQPVVCCTDDLLLRLRNGLMRKSLTGLT